MKKRSLVVLIALFFVLSSCKYLHIDGFSGSTLIWESGANNYFNQEAPASLKGATEIFVTGEVEGDQIIKLESLPWHSVTLREVVIDSDTAKFLGTFRYDGYALSDILSSVKIDKKSKEDFYPPVDLYIEIWNEKGEYAVFSWGELMYSSDVYNIILAKEVTRVIPGKTGEKWNLPQEMKLVAGGDMFAERAISSPTKIVIKSLTGDFKVNRDPEVFQAPFLAVSAGGLDVDSLFALPADLGLVTKKTIYYGHGQGYKGVKSFTGVPLDGVLKNLLPADKKSLREGLVCIEAVDGYRASFSLSEILNRVDAMEPLLMYGIGGEKGRESFSLYASADMFADRSIKGVSKIKLY